MPHWLAVFLGGGLGALGRYGLSGAVNRWLNDPVYPWGTLLCNVTGCLLIGLLGGFAESRALFSPAQRMGVFVGILGGFTTFSTFSYETLALLRSGQFGPAAANILLSVVLSILAVIVGYNVARTF